MSEQQQPDNIVEYTLRAIKSGNAYTIAQIPLASKVQEDWDTLSEEGGSLDIRIKTERDNEEESAERGDEAAAHGPTKEEGEQQPPEDERETEEGKREEGKKRRRFRKRSADSWLVVDNVSENKRQFEGQYEGVEGARYVVFAMIDGQNFGVFPVQDKWMMFKPRIIQEKAQADSTRKRLEKRGESIDKLLATRIVKSEHKPLESIEDLNLFRMQGKGDEDNPGDAPAPEEKEMSDDEEFIRDKDDTIHQPVETNDKADEGDEEIEKYFRALREDEEEEQSDKDKLSEEGKRLEELLKKEKKKSEHSDDDSNEEEEEERKRKKKEEEEKQKKQLKKVKKEQATPSLPNVFASPLAASAVPPVVPSSSSSSATPIKQKQGQQPPTTTPPTVERKQGTPKDLKRKLASASSPPTSAAAPIAQEGTSGAQVATPSGEPPKKKTRVADPQWIETLTKFLQEKGPQSLRTIIQTFAGSLGKEEKKQQTQTITAALLHIAELKDKIVYLKKKK